MRVVEKSAIAVVVGTLLAGASGCYLGLELEASGSLGDSDSGAGGPGGKDTDGDDDDSAPHGAADCSGPAVGPSTIARLTRTEYVGAVTDLLSVPAAAVDAEALPTDGVAAGFDSNTGQIVTTPVIEGYRDAAERVAAVAVDELVASDSAEYMPCSVSEADDGCIDEFIEGVALRGFRRPPLADELVGLRSVFDDGDDVFEGVGLVISAVLQSPSFLYRVEVGSATDDPEVFELSGYEIASRLSFALWRTGPDEELMRAASEGELDTAQGVAQWARQMLADSRADAAIADFHTKWLGLELATRAERDPNLFPEFDPLLAQQLTASTQEMVRSVLRDGDGSLRTLLGAQYTFATPQVAALYGVEAAPDHGADEYRRIKLPAGQRSGLLTEASVLAAYAHSDKTSPTLRGLFIRNKLLCETLPPPPPGVADDLPPRDPSKPLREQLEAHFSDSSCASCHRLLDPIGFGFEHYDAIGRYRERDGLFDVDAQGEVVDGQQGIEFYGIPELSEVLLSEPEVSACVSVQWLQFLLGRPEDAQDACGLPERVDAFDESGLDVRELIVATAESDAFRMRRRPTPAQ